MSGQFGLDLEEMEDSNSCVSEEEVDRVMGAVAKAVAAATKKVITDETSLVQGDPSVGGLGYVGISSVSY